MFTDIEELRKLVLEHIEYKQYPYAAGSDLRVGIAHDLSNRGISLPASFFLFTEDASYFESKLMSIWPFFRKLTDNRKMVLLALCFLWGMQVLFNKTELMLALECNDYERAAQELRRLEQVKLAQLME